MAEEVFTFDEAGMRAVVTMLREYQRRVTSMERQLNGRHEAVYKPARIYIAKTGGSGIPAATGGGATPGSATCTLYRMESGSLTAAVYAEAVYNLSTTAVTADTWVQVKEEALSNKFFVDNAGPASIGCARLTEDMSDSTPIADALDWEWDSDEEDFVETENEIQVVSFLRPPGETVAERTRFHYANIGAVKVAIVFNCDPDPEEEEE